ncbi:MAG: exo-alpha-sialidase [Akkermansiaceae bacterium]
MRHVLNSHPLRAIVCSLGFLASLQAAPLKVVSYNIKHGLGMDGKLDLERVAAVIAKEDPDLVALQEVDQNCSRSGKIDQAAELGRLLKMHHRFGKFMTFQGGEYGMAVLSRFPIEKTIRHQLPSGAEPRCALEIIVYPDGWQTPLSLIGIHHDWTEAELRVPQVKTLLENLQETKHPVILAGDFNAERDDDSLALLAAQNWKMLRTHITPTWPSAEPKVEIDFFFARDIGEISFQEKVIDEKGVSDHLPISLSLTQNIPALTPILNDGKPVQILSWRLPTKGAADHVSATIELSDLGDLETLSLIHHRGNGNRIIASTTDLQKKMTLDGPLDFPAGNHLIFLEATFQPGTNLDQKITIQVNSAITHQKKILATANPSATQRFAYPIHRHNADDCHTFRIPGLAKAPDDSLLAVYDMRYKSSRDLQGDIDIGLSRSTDGGQTWSKPRPIMDMGTYGGKGQEENGCSDPCILVDETTGEIFVFALWVHQRAGSHQWVGNGSMPGFKIGETAQFMMVKSSDYGLTWTDPINLTKQVKDPAWYLFAPAPGNGITLKDGTLVIPSQGRDSKGHPFSNITYSKDHGETWFVSAPARSNTTECSLAELRDGSLILNMRDNRNRSDKSATNGRAVSVTHDLGKTWTKHSSDHSLLTEPVCMASLIRHKNLLLFSNPNHRSRRTNITLRASLDDGTTWPKRLLLDSAGNGYGYSSLTMIDDQTVGILYESSQADLIFQRIPLNDLMKP